MVKKKIIPYKGKDWTWNHVIVEGFCLWGASGRNKAKDVPTTCAGEVGPACLGEGRLKCRFFGRGSVDPAERKAMIDGWLKFNKTHRTE